MTINVKELMSAPKNTKEYKFTNVLILITPSGFETNLPFEFLKSNLGL